MPALICPAPALPADWGKCHESWFNSAGYCAKTCGRCGAAFASAPASAPGCTDVPTPDGHSCQQQRDWGKCGEKFIKDNGYCKATCGQCGGSGGGGKPQQVQAYSGRSQSGRKLLLGGRRA